MASIQVTVKIAAPSGTRAPSTLVAEPPTASFPLPPSTSSPTDTTKPHDAHYTALLSALDTAQSSLNQTLTEWKDAIGDAEKPKEVVAKPGQGKAMLMVQGARETDGRKNPATMFDAEDGSEDEEDEA